jgi:hypothetical protein|tara:strand:+ start:1827 stop:1949 length:123 start_codon:yes stop_codon:yes gene_type:complete
MINFTLRGHDKYEWSFHYAQAYDDYAADQADYYSDMMKDK